MTERWKPVVGFEGVYEVSDHGRVRSIDRIAANGKRWKGRIRRPSVRKDYGHLAVNLYNGHMVCCRVHRLVLEAFVGPCPEGMEGCHFPDSNPANNRLDNLRWDTPTANHADKIVHGTTSRGERHGMSTLTEDDIRRMFAMRASNLTHQVIADAIGVHRVTVGKVLRGERWAHLGLAPC